MPKSYTKRLLLNAYVSRGYTTTLSTCSDFDLTLRQGSEHVKDMRDPSRANGCFTAKGLDGGCQRMGVYCE